MGKTTAETINEVTRNHLTHGNGLLLGQCVTAVGWIGGTVPDCEGIVELPMTDVAGPGFAVGCALMGRRPIFVAVVEDILSRVSKNQNKYVKLNVSDESGMIDVLMFNDSIDECKKMNNGLPEKGNIVIIKGTKKDESVFANLISVQDNRVYTKLSELKGA